MKTAFKSPHKTRHYNLLAKYGITADQYEAKLYRQANRCFICGKSGVQFKKGLCLDHNHKTGILRKFLCPKCNMLVGIHEDNPELLQSAMAYVWGHEEYERIIE